MSTQGYSGVLGGTRGVLRLPGEGGYSGIRRGTQGGAFAVSAFFVSSRSSAQIMLSSPGRADGATLSTPEYPEYPLGPDGVPLSTPKNS